MSIVDRWLLPDGVEDVLPPQAGRLEAVRRTLLDLYATWGYEYVVPPMVEYLESLLTGTGRDLDLKTLYAHLSLISDICRGLGPIGELGQADSFHWITAPHSTIIQSSPVHVGVCDDPEAELEHLMNALVRLNS